MRGIKAFFFFPSVASALVLTFRSNSAKLVLLVSTKGNKTSCPLKVTYTTAYIANPSAFKNLITCGVTRGLASQHAAAPFTKQRAVNGEV